jgi:hypothetical protein
VDCVSHPGQMWLMLLSPPMQEGHHVTGVRDLVGEPEDKLRSDCESPVSKHVPC